MPSNLDTITNPSTRHVMPREGKTLREGLYRDGHRPTLAEKLFIYEVMRLLIPEIDWYTRKKHLNWCYTREY